MTLNKDGLQENRVVISGISGRFPNSNNINELQENLLNKVDCTTTDHGRWDMDTPKVPQRIGKCNNIEKFDRVFFGVHLKLTANMDPISRILLEHSFEAIMDAGINPRSLKGSNVAVFVASSLSEFEKAVFGHKVQQNGFGIMGCSKAMIPNRISFFLGLTGSSINVDSACTGSATALERAYHAIKNGDCDAAIVAGSIMCLHPHISYQLKTLGRLSTDGRTRSFDDNADGHTRSDGMAVLFLQKATDAKRIYQEIVNVRTINAERHEVNTISYPRPEPQIKVMKEVLHESGLKPKDISFVEASGVGLRDYDAEELDAISAVYGDQEKPLLVGSVKSNLGDATAVNTINSIIKIIIASEIGQIPPNLHYKKPNAKALCLKEGKVCIPTELVPWIGNYTAVNTTSVSGTFSNILLKAPTVERKNDGIPEDDIPRLVIVSGRTEEAVSSFLNYVESRPVDAGFIQLMYDVFQSGIEGHLYRGYTIVPAKGLPDKGSKKQEMLFSTGEKREIWWIFSGMGSQWVGMGKDLLKLPVFKAAIEKCDIVLKPLGFDIYKIITDEDKKMFDQIVNSFIGIAAIQIGLVDVLHAVGLKPDYIIGHSVGELGCAYADGCFTAEQMIMAALSRGLASMETELELGSMAAVGLGYDKVKVLCPPDIDVACHNGPDSSTISGPAESMKKFVADLMARGIFAKEVPCSNIAYHSRYISPAGSKLLDRLQKVIPNPNPRSSKWVSSSVPRNEWNTLKARLSSAEYHTNNLLSPVLFDEASRAIPSNAICVEIAPHGLLQAILKRSLSERCINVALTRRGHPDNLEVLLSALGKLYNAGLQLQISNLYPLVEYPVGRGTASISSHVKWDHSADWLVNLYSPIESVKEGEKTFEINLNESENNYLKGNFIYGKMAVPLSLCLMNVWEILKSFDAEPILNVVFEDIKVHNPLIDVPNDNILRMTVMLARGSGSFDIMISNEVIVSGTLKSTKSSEPEKMNITKVKCTETVNELPKDDFYTEMQMRGFQYSESMRNVLKTSFDGTDALIKWTDNWISFIDSAFHVYAFTNDTRRPQVPLMIRKLIIDYAKHETASIISRVMPALLDKKVNCLSVGGMEIQGLKFSIIPRISEQNRFLNDTMKIVPNISSSDHSLSDNLRLILQLILENTFSDKIQRIQVIVNENEFENQEFHAAMRDIPEACLFRIENVLYENATFNKTLTIVTRLSKDHDLHDVSKKLGHKKFLLTFIDINETDSYIKLAESENLGVIAMRKFLNKHIILFRKKQSLDKIHIINAIENIDGVMEEIMNTKLLSPNERIVVVYQFENRNAINELVEKLQKITNMKSIRIYIIEDPRVSRALFTEERFYSQAELDLLINILTRQNTWATIRRVHVTPNLQPCTRWSANKMYSYDPLNITWTEGPILETIENLVRVEYSTLNPQDILLANGTFYSDIDEVMGNNRLQEAGLGLEFSGVDKKNNRVMGVTCGNSMSNATIMDPDWTWIVPDSWSLEDAATVPLSYLVAYSALVAKSQVRTGDKVLISSASDGLGLALLHLAVHENCEVFVTYTTEAEKELIQSSAPGIPSSHLFKLTDHSNLQDEILLSSDNNGFDVIICNQCEIKRLELFFTMAKHYARVVLIDDLSNNRIHESIGMYIFLKEISFYSVVTKRILSSDLETKKTLIDMIESGIKSGSVKPLARSVYSRNSLREAFNACKENKYHGKIVVKVQPEENMSNKILALPRFFCSNKKCYLILGALTSFSLELIDWLIVRGARKFIIASSIQINNAYINYRMNIWRSYGVEFILRNDLDLSLNHNVKSLFSDSVKLGSVDAIFMMSSDDSIASTILSVDRESRLTCPNLRLFVVCSSITNIGSLSVLGKLGHANTPNYCKLRNILEKRKKVGLPALMIKWGLKAPSELERNDPNNNILPSETKYLEKLDEILGREEIIVDVSFLANNTTEIEPDKVDVEAEFMTPEERENAAFVASLYKQYGVHTEGLSYLQVD